jgi:hypothetical protein
MLTPSLRKRKNFPFNPIFKDLVRTAKFGPFYMLTDGHREISSFRKLFLEARLNIAGMVPLLDSG